MLAILAALVLIGFTLWMGLTGVFAGRRVAASRGADSLMHYPVPLPWLRGRVNSAHRVIALGRFYAGSGLVGGVVLMLIGMSTISQTKSSPCVALAPPDEVAEIIGEAVHVQAVRPFSHRCTAEVMSTETERTLVGIEISASAALIGAEFNNQKAELSRQGHMIQLLPRLGEHALLAWNPDARDQDAIILFQHGAATARLTIAGALNAPADPTPWTDLLLANRAHL